MIKKKKMAAKKTLREATVVAALKTVKDPEVGFDVWTMGLIYKLNISKNDVNIVMTYTTPFCPWGPQLNDEITEAIKAAGATRVVLTVTFDPPYKMPDALRATLGL